MHIQTKLSAAPRRLTAGERPAWRLGFFILLVLVLAGCNLPMEPAPGPTQMVMPTGRLVLPIATEPPSVVTSVPTATTASTKVQPTTPVKQPSAIPTLRAATAKPTAAPTLAPTNPYPAQPEAVLTSYLAAYPDAPEEMRRYLSAELRRNLDAAGALRLVQITGQLMGFAIQSGSQSNNPPRSVLLVALNVDGNEIRREFTLIREDNRWVIDAVEVK